VVAAVVLAIIVTGLLMLAKIDTAFWRRDPYWLTDRQWGIVYTIHGLAAMAAITLVMVHIYLGVRPDKWWMTRSMFTGWIARADYDKHHDPTRWDVPGK
jgi:thiosulfate reductase cytochrome b subunit